MSIELTNEQADAIAAEGNALVVIDPQTNQAYRLVREEVFKRVQALLYDDSTWSAHEKAVLAGTALSKLDDTDYSLQREFSGRESTGLVMNSVVSCITLTTIEKSLVANRIGHFSAALMLKVNDSLKVALELP